VPGLLYFIPRDQFQQDHLKLMAPAECHQKGHIYPSKTDAMLYHFNDDLFGSMDNIIQ